MSGYDEYYSRQEPHGYGLDTIIAVIDDVLNTKRKRHITGGILLSVSLLFGGLALTVMSIKTEEDDDE